MGIFFAILSMLGFGLHSGVAKIPSQKLSTEKSIFWRGIFVSSFLFLVLLFNLSQTTFDLLYILMVLGIALVGYIGVFSFVKALKFGKVGVVVPVANSSMIYTVLLSLLFFQESLASVQIIALITIIFGIVLISINFSDLKGSKLLSFSSGIPYAIITSIAWGITFFLLKIPVLILGPFLTSFSLEFFQGIIAFFQLKGKKKSLKLLDRSMLPYLIALGILGTIGSLGFNLGVRIANVGVVSAIMSSNPLISTLYGRFVFKERLRFQQYVAIVMIVGGIVGITLG